MEFFYIKQNKISIKSKISVTFNLLEEYYRKKNHLERIKFNALKE